MNDRKIAIVTGASSGIGKDIAFGLAEDGYRVVLTARREQRLKDVAAEMVRKLGLAEDCTPIVRRLDVTDEADIRELVADIDREYGRIDLLFNNAGLGTSGSLELDVAELDRLLAVNLRGPFAMMKNVVPVMLRQKRGQIINLASKNGKVGVVGLGGYTASKFGLVGLSEVVYRELAAQGIKVTTLCPGWVNTDMAAQEGSPHNPADIIQTSDIMKTVRWLLGLGRTVSIMEVMLECSLDVERRSTIEYARNKFQDAS